jgi:hypothetical protein
MPEHLIFCASLTRRPFRFSVRNRALKGPAKLNSPLRGSRPTSRSALLPRETPAQNKI